MNKPVKLRPAPLEKSAFTPFGDVIEIAGAKTMTINQGSTVRYHDLANIQVGAEDGGRVLVNIFRGTPLQLPLDVILMERHPLGSQAFIPLCGRPFVVLVAPAGAPPTPASMRAFLASGDQGVNYAPGVWHHPLIALGEQGDFLVIDRGGGGHNLDEVEIAPGSAILLGPG